MSKCLEWQGTVSDTGYGMVWRDGRYVLAHRLAYCEHHQLNLEDIAGQMVLHSCDNRRCINPDHLRLGTHADNMKDMVERGRWAGGAPRSLAQEQEDTIRSLYVPRSRTHGTRALSKEYGVNQATISRIINRS